MYNCLIIFSHSSYSIEVQKSQKSYLERLLEYFSLTSISKSFEVWVYYEKK